MKENFFYKLIVGAILCSSCNTIKPLTSDINPTEINDIQKFDTYSYITLIGKDNKGALNDTISNSSKTIFQEALKTFTHVPITGYIKPTEINVLRNIEKEIEYLFMSAESQRNISNLKLTPVLDSLLEASGKRFGLLSITSGFTRAKGNYAGQIAKETAKGILTLGLYYQTPIMANSTIYVMIIDGKRNNITFFNKSSLNDKEPLDKNVLTKQLQNIFNRFFGY